MIPEELEPIDIYDEHRNRTGLTIPRGEAHLKEGQFMLYVIALLENHEGKFLITQRSLDKSWGAGWWEVPGGGVLSGEEPADTIVREVREEVGLDVAGLVGEAVYSYENIDLARGDNYFTDIFHLRFDFGEADVVLQTSEAAAFKLATWDEIAEIGARGEFLHFERLKQALEAERGA